jgi:hypothetical protein
MRAFAIVSCLLVSAQSAAAMVYTDSRVVSLAELAREGIRVEVRRPAGLSGRVYVSVEVLAVDRTFQSMEFSVVDKPLDADFASTDPKKVGIRESKRWAKEERSSSTEKKVMTFPLTRAESSRCYVRLRFTLPPNPKDGLPVFGSYYIIVSDAEK